jgi:hypothetical protein
MPSERRLRGLKSFVGLLVAAAGFGLSFLIEPLGWVLMLSDSSQP